MATQISSLTTLVNGVNSYDCFLPLVDPTLALDSRNVKIRISTHNEMFSNNFAVASLSSYANYFGTGKDGSLTISSSAQVSASLNNISREFGDPVIKNFQNLTIGSGILFSPLRACMTGKGGGVGSKVASPIGFATSTDSRYDLVDGTLYFNNFSSSTAGGYGIPTHWNWAPSGSVWFRNYKIRVPLSGSVDGGNGASTAAASGNAGSAGIFSCGGGGGGGSGESQYGTFGSGASGGRGTIFSGGGGGGGGGGGCCGGNVPGTSGILERGGAGGASPNGPAGGGAGTTTTGGNGTLGVGGLLILIVRGNIIINGTISSNGASGGNGVRISKGSGGGGGSGGGRIIITYGGTYTNAGSVVANGGSGGSASSGGGPGASGGAGSITTRKIHI